MRKIKLKRRRKKLNIFIFTIILIVISVFIGLNSINKKISPLFLEYADKKVEKLIVETINAAVSEESKKIDLNTLFVTEDNQVDFDPKVINELLTNITFNISDRLTELELNDKVIFYMPLSVGLKNIVLSNIGPKIPVKINMIGDIKTDVKVDIEEYGINNALVSILIEVNVKERIILPFTKKEIEVNSDIPVALKLIEGEIPNYYIKNPVTNN